MAAAYPYFGWSNIHLLYGADCPRALQLTVKNMRYRVDEMHAPSLFLLEEEKLFVDVIVVALAFFTATPASAPLEKNLLGDFFFINQKKKFILCKNIFNTEKFSVLQIFLLKIIKFFLLLI